MEEEIHKLRGILLGCGLNEELKWGVPSYTLNKSNIVIIHVFKEYCAVLFFKGALLNDPQNILVQQTENVQAARQIRFTSMQEVNKMERNLKAYIYEALEVEKAGLKVELKKTTEFNIPLKFQNRLTGKDGDALKIAFCKLTPGRQRGYLLYFFQPKKAKTRESRIEKSIEHILKGKGLNDE